MSSKSEHEAHRTDRVAGVRTELRRRILTWEYAPGTRLIEEDLSREFGVSRGPLREALGQLQVAGFITKIRNKGYTVKQPNLTEVKELYDLRLALELHAVEGLTRKPASEELVDELYRIWEEPVPDNADVAEVLACRDQVFHERIAEAFGNDTLLFQLKRINERIYVFRRIDFARERAIASPQEHHRDIVDAIKDGDLVRARAAMRENLEHAEAHVESALKEMLWGLHTRTNTEEGQS